MRIGKFNLITIAAVFAMMSLLLNSCASQNADEKTFSGNAEETVESMTVGWNLGNTFDSTATVVLSSALNRTENEGTDYETLWGSPVITSDMIEAVCDKGFNTIRIPVTWGHHLIDDGNGNVTISASFLSELKRVVDLAYNAGMYVILNSHHDTSDYSKGLSVKAAGDTGLTWDMLYPYELFNAGDLLSNTSQCENVSRLWTAIAEAFQDYDNHLLFEGFNEIQGDERDWSEPGSVELNNTNNLNQAFVDAVRATGGNNAERILIVQSYAGSNTSECVQAVSVSDSADDCIIEEVHLYTNETGKDLTARFEELKEYAPYPIIIGEYGYESSYDSSTALAELYYGASEVSRSCGIPLIYWDNGDIDSYGLFDRETLSWDKAGTDVAAEVVAGFNA